MLCLTEGVYAWQAFDPEKKYNFNGFILTEGGHTTVIDPPALSREDEVYFDRLKVAPDFYIVTNRNHLRALDWFRKRSSAALAMHAAEAARVGIKVDRKLQHGDMLRGGIEVIHLPGKSPGEIGLFWRSRRILMLGDALAKVNGFLDTLA